MKSYEELKEEYNKWWNYHFGWLEKWLLIIITLFIGLLLGWLNPNEGPFDYVYDEYSSQPAHKRPPRGIPAPPPKKVEIYQDLNEDGEPEWYQVVPLYEVQE